MLRTRVIPTLLLRNESLVKTIKFGKYVYIGDPCNTVRIFNELEVDELIFLDITATVEGRAPNLEILADIANECFMPLGYGGGVKTFEQAKSIFQIGFEKIVINSHAIENPVFISELSKHFGNQAVIASIDVRKSFFGHYSVRTYSGKKKADIEPTLWARRLEELGAGEIIITSIGNEGTWSGYDIDLVKTITEAVSIPVVAHGGAGCLQDLSDAVKLAGASAVAAGSLFVFQKKDMGVLINYPTQDEQENLFGDI